MSKGIGRLGLFSLSMFNKVLLGKWIWRFVVEDNSTWRTMMRSLKCGTKGRGWFSNSPKGSYGVGLWKEINKEATQLKNHCFLKSGMGVK